MAVYYNDNDPKVCAWLRELIKAGLVADGEVDERSIKEICADDLKGFTQHHFFAGIGGWSYALRLAGWPDDRPVWTGSCPCQPWSPAGKKLAEKDPRHLWPDWFRLIDQCRPTAIFGEQTYSPSARRWLSGVRSDLETLGYAVGAADLCAAGVGSPQIRQRLWWVSYASINQDRPRSPGSGAQSQIPTGGHDSPGGTPNTPSMGRRSTREPSETVSKSKAVERLTRPGDVGFWDAFDILPFQDGKARRVEAGTFPLAHGVPARVLRLRGYGNTINPQTAATFIRAAQILA